MASLRTVGWPTSLTLGQGAPPPVLFLSNDDDDRLLSAEAPIVPAARSGVRPPPPFTQLLLRRPWSQPNLKWAQRKDYFKLVLPYDSKMFQMDCKICNLINIYYCQYFPVKMVYLVNPPLDSPPGMLVEIATVLPGGGIGPGSRGPVDEWWVTDWRRRWLWNDTLPEWSKEVNPFPSERERGVMSLPLLPRPRSGHL